MPFEHKLNDEIATEIQRLEGLEVGTDAYRATVDGVTKLMDRAIELKKIDANVKAQAKAQEEEHNLKLIQLRDDRIDKISRNVLTGFTFGGTMFTIWCLASATFTFEEKGTITSTLGRKVLGMLVPKL